MVCVRLKVAAVASGAYQTSLLTYFIQRDLFPAIINVRVAARGQSNQS